MTHAELAAVTGLAKRQVSYWASKGMPTNTAEAANEWLTANRTRPARNQIGTNGHTKHNGQAARTVPANPASPGAVHSQRERLEAGELNRAEIETLKLQISVLRQLDEYQIDHGKLLDADSVAGTWSRTLERIKSVSATIPAAASALIASDLSLEPTAEIRVRRILNEAIERFWGQMRGGDGRSDNGGGPRVGVHGAGSDDGGGVGRPIPDGGDAAGRGAVDDGEDAVSP